jgi:microcystin-dependent protein
MKSTIGEVQIFAGLHSLELEGWKVCNGQDLDIKNYPDLFKIIGTTYGGDGTTTFKPPDTSQVDYKKNFPAGCCPAPGPCTLDNYYDPGPKAFRSFICTQGLIPSASTNMGGFTGQVKTFAGNFSAKNWAYCNGQVVDINDENQNLFPLIKNSYGGDGNTTFAMPDTRAIDADLNVVPTSDTTYFRQHICINGQSPLTASLDSFLGTLTVSASCTFNTDIWFPCDAQILAISENSALFSLLGTTYGGDGRTAFGLPATCPYDEQMKVDCVSSSEYVKQGFRHIIAIKGLYPLVPQ